MSNDFEFYGSVQDPNLTAVVTELESYIKCTDLSLTRDAHDENFLMQLLLLGISGGKKDDIINPSLFFHELHSQGNRQVCQYQFKRYRVNNFLRILRHYVFPSHTISTNLSLSSSVSTLYFTLLRTITQERHRMDLSRLPKGRDLRVMQRLLSGLESRGS